MDCDVGNPQDYDHVCETLHVQFLLLLYHTKTVEGVWIR